MAFACAVDPEDVTDPEPLQVIPVGLAEAGAVLPPALVGAAEDGVEVPELLEPQAATAMSVLAASAADPYWLQRRVERPTVT